MIANDKETIMVSEGFDVSNLDLESLGAKPLHEKVGKAIMQSNNNSDKSQIATDTLDTLHFLIGGNIFVMHTKILSISATDSQIRILAEAIAEQKPKYLNQCLNLVKAKLKESDDLDLFIFQNAIIDGKQLFDENSYSTKIEEINLLLNTHQLALVIKLP